MVKVKNKKSNLADIYAQKRRPKTKSLTPFEIHVNRSKQNVLGRKSKTDKGLPGISRAKAINKRKSTLLQEFKVKDKDNIFLDRRIGEKNRMMTQEEKTMARFAAERIKAHKKKNIFNLNDEEVLTHRGQALMDIEKFDEPYSDDDIGDNETGKLDSQFVEDAHFGGGVLSKPSSEMSRKDLIDQLIAESKKRKAERQKIREQTVDLTEKLDTEWKDLQSLMFCSDPTTNSEKDDEAKNPTTAPQSKADPYDIAVRELRTDARGMPSEKLKSEEEIAKEEKDRLEQFEQERLARMKGFADDDDMQIRHKSADDLDDHYLIEDINQNTAEEEEKSENDKDNSEDEMNSTVEEEKENEIGERDSIENEEEEEKEGDSEEDNQSPEEEESEEDNLSDLKESESSSEDEDQLEVDEVDQKEEEKIDDDYEDGSCNDADNKIIHRKNDPLNTKADKESKKETLEKESCKGTKQKQNDVNYYKAPESFQELEQMFHNRSVDQQSVIVDRILKCHTLKLNEGNKQKLIKLLEYLLQYLDNCATTTSVKGIVKMFQIFDRLCPQLYDLAHINAEETGRIFREILQKKHDNFEKNKKKYPGVDVLIFFKLVAIIFPTSDFRHPIATPCLVFMSQILLRSKIKKRSDLSKGLFLCTLMLEYTILSKRFAPSVINFLRGVLFASVPKNPEQKMKTIPPFKSYGEGRCLLVLAEKARQRSVNADEIYMNAEDLVTAEIDEDFKIKAVMTALRLTLEFVQQLQELDAAYSIFEPILKLLETKFLHNYPKTVRQKGKKLREQLISLKNKQLHYLVLPKKRPKTLRLYEPRIEAVYEGKRHKPMSKERAEREKLLHKLKKETKSAIREVRRDTAFLAKVQIKQQIKSDEERKRKVKEIFGDAAMQQAELKKKRKK